MWLNFLVGLLWGAVGSLITNLILVYIKRKKVALKIYFNRRKKVVKRAYKTITKTYYSLSKINNVQLESFNTYEEIITNDVKEITKRINEVLSYMYVTIDDLDNFW